MATLTSDLIPTSETLTSLSQHPLLSSTGAPTPLSTILATTPRTLLIFIRHFYCGSCQQYIARLSSTPSLAPDSLSAHPKGTTKLIVVGCGDWSLIDQYKKDQNAPWEFYTDPTGEIYDKLGMIKSLTMGEKPEYIKEPIISTVVKGIVGAVRRGPLKGGDIRRVILEFVLASEGKAGSNIIACRLAESFSGSTEAYGGATK
jgi:hypothetical protein